MIDSIPNVSFLVALRDEYYEATGDAPNWKRLARRLNTADDDAFQARVVAISKQVYASY